MDISKPKYFPALTGLRVILASMVFIYHYSGLGNQNLTITQIAVVLKYRMTAFFVLSGFVVMYSLLPKGRLSLKEYIKFILFRLLRLLPLYYVLLIVPYLQVGIPPLPVFISNITLTKGFFSELLTNGIGPSWSLTPEITFYLLAPYLLRYVSDLKRFILCYFVILLTGITLISIGTYLVRSHYNTYGFFADLKFTLSYTFFGRATDFFVGMFLAHLVYQFSKKDLPVYLKNSLTYTSLFLIILISYFVYYFENSTTQIASTLSLICLYFVLPFAVGCFLWGLTTEKTFLNKFLSLKWMVILGNGAYGFYLMHTGWVQYKLEKINFLPDHGFILLWITAALTYYMFEKPIILYLKKKLVY